MLFQKWLKENAGKTYANNFMIFNSEWKSRRSMV